MKSSVYFFQTLASTPVLICINTTGDNSITTGLWCYTWTWRLVSNDLSLLKEKIKKQPHRAPPNAMVLYVTLCMLNLLLILFEGIKVWYFLPPNINKSNNYCTLLLLHIIREPVGTSNSKIKFLGAEEFLISFIDVPCEVTNPLPKKKLEDSFHAVLRSSTFSSVYDRTLFPLAPPLDQQKTRRRHINHDANNDGSHATTNLR